MVGGREAKWREGGGRSRLQRGEARGEEVRGVGRRGRCEEAKKSDHILSIQTDNKQ